MLARFGRLMRRAEAAFDGIGKRFHLRVGSTSAGVLVDRMAGRKCPHERCPVAENGGDILAEPLQDLQELPPFERAHVDSVGDQQRVDMQPILHPGCS